MGNYDEEVMSWRANLNQHDVRSMASEYLRGIRTPDNCDAYDEFLFRGYDKEESKPEKARKASRRSAYKAKQSRDQPPKGD